MNGKTGPDAELFARKCDSAWKTLRRELFFSCDDWEKFARARVRRTSGRGGSVAAPAPSSAEAAAPAAVDAAPSVPTNASLAERALPGRDEVAVAHTWTPAETLARFDVQLETGDARGVCTRSRFVLLVWRRQK